MRPRRRAPTRGDAPADPLLDATRLAAFLRGHRLPPLDRFGQHFLVDPDVLADIVTATATDPRVPVMEVGAGLGVLTRALARAREERRKENGERSVAPLIAVELDRRLIPLLIKRTKEFPSVRVVQEDILRLNLARREYGSWKLEAGNYDVVGNVPYNITAPLLRKFLDHPPRPRRMTILVDEAVADAIVARPPRTSLRAVSAQVFAEPTIVRRGIPPTAFVPPPAVRSAILVLVPRARALVAPDEERAFFRLVRAGFSQKRKMLGNALAAAARIAPAEAAACLRRAGVDPARRAQTLHIEEWTHVLRGWDAALPRGRGA